MENELELRAKLYNKKSEARAYLKTIPLTKEGRNTYNNYNYFSEAQYKEIITDILLKFKLEITGNLLVAESITGIPKKPIGARAVVAFTLIDLETGYCETHNGAGDGLDNGDKSIYKAQTGAFKYYMANNFQITTDDDPDKDPTETVGKGKKPQTTPANQAPQKQTTEFKSLQSKAKVETLYTKALDNNHNEDDVAKVLKAVYGKQDPAMLTDKQYDELLERVQK